MGRKNTGATEADAIRALNESKGFFSPRRKGKDTGEPANQEISEAGESSNPIRVVSGRDSEESESDTPSTPVQQPSKVVPAMSANKDGTLTITQSQLRAMVEKAAERDTVSFKQHIADLESKVASAQQVVAQLQDKAEKEKEELLRQIDEEKAQRDTLAQVFTEFGFNPDGSVPAGEDRYLGGRSGGGNVFIAPMSTREGISSRDAFKEFDRILNDTATLQPRSVVNLETGTSYIQKDTRMADRWVKEHRDKIREGMTDVAKKVGLLQGRVADYTGKDAPTTFANFPVVLREYLSSVVRIEHSARFVLWQFANRNVATGVPPNQTTLIPRVRHLETGATSAAWRLVPGTPTTADRQNLAGNNIALPIYEWGLGLDATLRPVAIADIVAQTNLLDLESLLQDRIGYNYHTWEDKLLFELLLSTTRVAYNSNDGVVALPADVTGGGQLTLNFLGALRSAMSTDLIPPLPDGCYIYVGPPDAIAQLENDIQLHHAYADMAGAEELMNMLSSKTRNDYMGRLNGYRGRIRGFHVYESTSFSVGIPGTPGVQTETVTGGTVTSVTTRTGFAMGADAIGWATSLPMEIREDNDNNFQRIRSLLWKSHENATGLDIDPDRTILANEIARPVGAEEQLRVYQVRTSTIPVV